MIRATAQYTPRGDGGRFVDARIRPAVREAVGEAADYVLGVAKSMVPVRTGELRDSGASEVRETLKTVTGVIKFTAKHAGYVEYGTGQRGAASAGRGPYPYSMYWPGMPAHPYLRPAVDISRGHVKDLLRHAVALAVRK